MVGSTWQNSNWLTVQQVLGETLGVMVGSTTTVWSTFVNGELQASLDMGILVDRVVVSGMVGSLGSGHLMVTMAMTVV